MASSVGAAEAAEGAEEAEGCARVIETSGEVCATAAPEEASGGNISTS